MPELKEAQLPRYEHASDEPIDIIRRNECDSQLGSVVTGRFQALWNAYAEAAEEVEKLRADKERLDRLESNVSRREVADMLRADVFSSLRDLIDRTLRILDPQDAARSLQTNGRVPESTPEAKQEASLARKEKAE